MQREPRAILFDLDDTLYDFVKPAAMALEAISHRMEADLGLSSDDVRAGYLRILREQMQRNPTAGCHSRCIRFQLLFEEHHLPIRHAPEYNDLYWRELVSRIEPFDGVVEALAALRARGIRLGVGTNMTADWQIRKLVQLGLDESIDFLVSSEEAGSEKPEKAFFEYAARKVGCAPEECLFIGDNPVTDMQGALGAGMRVLWFQPDAEKAQKRVDLPSFSSYRNLLHALDME